MKKNMKRMLGLGMAVMMTMGVLAGCGGEGSGKDGQTSSEGEKVLTFGCQNYGDGLVDPTNQTNAAWNCMRYGIGECLFKFNDSMETEGWLADSYEVSDDHLTWTIKLKDGIKFSDGCDMTATKVKESLDRLKTEGPKPGHSSAPDKYLEYEAEITADDEANTITIKTVTAYPNLPGITA